MSKERIEKLKKLIRDNKAFNREYKEEIKQLESETVLEVGRWYKYGNFLLHIKSISNDIIGRYGFDMIGGWHECVDELAISNELTLATDKEVEEALIEEAKNRGFEFDYYNYASAGTYKSNFYGYDVNVMPYDIFVDGKWLEPKPKTIKVLEGDYTVKELQIIIDELKKQIK